jgi:uncharacterized protein
VLMPDDHALDDHALDDHALEALDDAECRRLLASATIGRLAFTDGALPAVVPVPFALVDDSVVIPVRRDDPLAHAARGAVMAFEVDSYVDRPGAGWSVTVVGPSTVVDRPGGMTRIERLDLFPAVRPGLGSYVTVGIGLVRGWRLAGDGARALVEGMDAAALL